MPRAERLAAEQRHAHMTGSEVTQAAIPIGGLFPCLRPEMVRPRLRGPAAVH